MLQRCGAGHQSRSAAVRGRDDPYLLAKPAHCVHLLPGQDRAPHRSQRLASRISKRLPGLGQGRSERDLSGRKLCPAALARSSGQSTYSFGALRLTLQRQPAIAGGAASWGAQRTPSFTRECAPGSPPRAAGSQAAEVAPPERLAPWRSRRPVLCGPGIRHTRPRGQARVSCRIWLLRT